MARLVTWAALAVAVGAVIGCGPGKDLPDALPETPDAVDTPVAVPAASDPAAKAYLDKGVKAYTGNKPELVDKGKFSRAVLKGKQYRVGDIPVVETVRNISAVWPDRYVDTDEQQAQGHKSLLTAYLHRPNLIVIKDGLEQATAGNQERERNFVADATGQFWMALFIPATAPKAIAYDLRQGTYLPPGATQMISAQTLKLSIGDLPIYQLTFDAKSDLLVRVEFTSSLFGTTTRQMWTMTDHKTGPEGLFLPSKTELRMNNIVVEEWVVDKWEFPAAINDSEFSPPKK